MSESRTVLRNFTLHSIKTKKFTSAEVWIPTVYSEVFVSIEKIYQTLGTVFHRLSPRISSKILRCASYFQLSLRCLDIPMKHCFSCLIYYFKYSVDQLRAGCIFASLVYTRMYKIDCRFLSRTAFNRQITLVQWLLVSQFYELQESLQLKKCR